jgi:hypothetical protein
MGWLSNRLPAAGCSLAYERRAGLPVSLPWCGSKEARSQQALK